MTTNAARLPPSASTTHLYRLHINPYPQTYTFGYVTPSTVTHLTTTCPTLLFPPFFTLSHKSQTLTLLPTTPALRTQVLQKFFLALKEKHLFPRLLEPLNERVEQIPIYGPRGWNGPVASAKERVLGNGVVSNGLGAMEREREVIASLPKEGRPILGVLGYGVHLICFERAKPAEMNGSPTSPTFSNGMSSHDGSLGSHGSNGNANGNANGNGLHGDFHNHVNGNGLNGHDFHSHGANGNGANGNGVHGSHGSHGSSNCTSHSLASNGEGPKLPIEYLYIARRSHLKHTYPGMLDSAVGGTMRVDETPFECLLREAREEASIPEHVIKTHARSCGSIKYINYAGDMEMAAVDGRDSVDGLEVRGQHTEGRAERRERRKFTELVDPEGRFLFDMEMDGDSPILGKGFGIGEEGLLRPAVQFVWEMEVHGMGENRGGGDGWVLEPSDGEVDAFRRMRIEEVQEALVREEFPPSVAMVLVDALVRWGIVSAETDKDFGEICRRLKRGLEFPTM